MVTSSIRAPFLTSEPQPKKPVEAYLSTSAVDLQPRRTRDATTSQAFTPQKEFSTLSLHPPRSPLIKYQVGYDSCKPCSQLKALLRINQEPLSNCLV